MRLICPNCAAQYEIDAAVLPEKGRDVECSRCGQIWFQPRPAPQPSAPQPTDLQGIGPQGTDPSQPEEFDAAARPALNRSLSDSVLSVLREEAARELRAREEDRARARAEKARFEAESFAPAPLPEFPFVDDRTEERTQPGQEVGSPAPEAALIDWPATTITDERILEAPPTPRDDLTEDEWIVSAPPLDKLAPDSDQTEDAGNPVAQADPGPAPDAIPDDEPVATILFDEPGTREADRQSAVAPAAPPADDLAKGRKPAPAATISDLPRDLPGDTPDHDSPVSPDHDDPDRPVETAPATQLASLPVSVETRREQAPAPARSGYGRGFGLAIGVAAALAGFYLIAPHLVGAGAIGEFATDYRAAADQGRVWLGDRVGALTSGRD